MARSQDANSPQPVLHPRRALALKAYIETGSFTAASIASGVSRQRVSVWSKSPQWRHALAKASAAILPPQRVSAKRLLNASINQLARDLTSDDPKLRSKAGHLIFSKLSTLLVAENFEDEIEELTSRLAKLQNGLNGSRSQKAVDDNDEEEFDDEEGGEQ